MPDGPNVADLDADDAEIERLRAKAAERTSIPRAAFRAKLERMALDRAVDPHGALGEVDRFIRTQLLRDSLDEAQLDALVAVERSRFMAEIGRLSARNRRGRRVARLRRTAGEQ